MAVVIIRSATMAILVRRMLCSLSQGRVRKMVQIGSQRDFETTRMELNGALEYWDEAPKFTLFLA